MGQAGEKRGVVLLATCNGAAHLAEQLASHGAQTHTAWDLIVSDDGSGDDTRAIVDRFAAQWQGCHEVTWQNGPCRGVVRNFFSLLRAVPAGAQWAALSDQDDVWFPDKTARALAALAKAPAGRPALYCARTCITTEDLRVIGPSRHFRRPPDFRNALVQSIGGGNTMVLNRAAIDLVQAAVVEAQEAAVHDWWLYQIITACGGLVLRDDQPVLYYRQHGGNQIGANLGLVAWLRRMSFILAGRFTYWNALNLRALAASRHRFTAEAAQVFDTYAAARQGSMSARLRALRRAGVWRQGRAGTAALYLACLLGRI